MRKLSEIVHDLDAVYEKNGRINRLYFANLDSASVCSDELWHESKELGEKMDTLEKELFEALRQKYETRPDCAQDGPTKTTTL